MNRLSLEQVLKDNNTRDPNSISSLKLNHKALSDVSCLSEFKNLERLDLSFNNLTSLEGLKSCVNLKWLSVANNKLQSLKGIEGLSKLTVLNAGKNKLKVMDEVMSIVSLRAVILNDNEIASVCRLEPLRDLNTLVLSRNPIRDIGDSLMKVKSITKLSLSHCQLQTIQSSLKSCIELKELRLAHNDIKVLPAELALNKKLQNLDLGNNVITRWSDLKVLDSLVNLKNLNLQGNPMVEKDKLAKKIKRILPNLHVFNARPIDKYTKNEKGAGVDEVDDSSLNAANKQESQTEKRKDRDFKHLMMAGTKGGIGKLENSSDSDTKKLKPKSRNRITMSQTTKFWSRGMKKVIMSRKRATNVRC
ncbi:protein phosphatase 1 regulatory subunit 7 [Prunus yedoensis var. nudiflora]|uniref:Protein phosphatase 1 regulatory subunit 7 n=1 Tax=Prunus yedoensis var. nudiflora TaxID=2094558 RepID=A0A314YSK8_PRUYE|nr:protein phosphatase 1 regulatory subunit 7 [Prunus yedoensis var. nudiflora]